MDRKRDIYTVNLFKPKKGYMKAEVIIILTALFGWGMMIFGFQAFVWLIKDSSYGQALLTRITLFHLPFHFWLPPVPPSLVHHPVHHLQSVHRPSHRTT